MGTSSLLGWDLTNKVRSLRPSESATCNENSLCPSRLTTSRIKVIWLPSGETANLPSRPSMSFVGTPPINDTRYKALGSPLTNKRLCSLLSNPNPAIRSAVSSSTFVFDASCRTQISTEFCERRVYATYLASGEIATWWLWPVAVSSTSFNRLPGGSLALISVELLPPLLAEIQ